MVGHSGRRRAAIALECLLSLHMLATSRARAVGCEPKAAPPVLPLLPFRHNTSETRSCPCLSTPFPSPLEPAPGHPVHSCPSEVKPSRYVTRLRSR